MNNPEPLIFLNIMIRLAKANSFNAEQLKLIECINTIRRHYPWSQKVYDASSLENVYLILNGKNAVIGFIEGVYKDQDSGFNQPLSIYLEELHVAPSKQGKGVGQAVLEQLLRKGVGIKMTIANENKPMLSLVAKFKPELKYQSTNTCTVIIRPE